MANENAVMDDIKLDDIEDLDFESFEASLNEKLAEQELDYDTIAEEMETIGNPESLGNTVKDIVWDQFRTNIANIAGEEFIKENNGLTLDLRNDAHIQTAENFKNGKIAKHNYISNEQLEQNYDRFSNTPHGEFRKEYVNPGMNTTLQRAGKLKKQGVDTVKDIYTGKQIPTQTKLENGKNNPKAAQREHVKSSAELYENSSLQMANNNEELAAIINNPENLQGYTTAERNNRKSDNSASDMSDNDKTKHWEKAHDKAEEYVTKKEQEGEERLKKEGRKTQKKEAARIGKAALKSAIMPLLAELLKEITKKLIQWLKSAQKSMQTLISYIKEAISSFISKLKTHLANAGKSIITTILNAILGPIVRTISKIFNMLKQGWASLKQAIDFLKAPENKHKSVSVLVAEVSKIIIAGLTAGGALALGEIIEKGLMAIPPLAIEIPILGSLASLLGLFLGGLVAGIAGALALNMIDKFIAKKKKEIAINNAVNKNTEILDTQERLIQLKKHKMDHVKSKAAMDISDRHKVATEQIQESLENIFHSEESDNVKSDNEHDFNDMFSKLNKLKEKNV